MRTGKYYDSEEHGCLCTLISMITSRQDKKLGKGKWYDDFYYKRSYFNQATSY